MTNRTNIHETLRREEEIERGTDRGFGLVMATVFAIVGLWPLVFGEGYARVWALIVAALLLIAAVAIPRILKPLNTIWLKFGLLLSRVVNPIVLGLMFYLLITPFALALRLLGKDLLRLRRDPQATSYWINRDPPGPSPESMRNQF